MKKLSEVGFWGATVVSLFVGQSTATAQDAPIVDIVTPDATIADEFSRLRGFRELSDGRVVVTDWIEQRVAVVDFSDGEVRQLGSVGGGPREYRLPRQLVRLPRDSTLLVDVGNSRLLVIDPSLTFTRSISLTEHGERFEMNPRVSDSLGRVYFTPSPFAFGLPPRDSVPVARWGASSPLKMFETVLIGAYTPRTRQTSAQMGIPTVMFAGQDDWTVTPDGWIVVVRSSPYRVDWYGPDGEEARGAPVPYDVLEVTRADRREAVREFLLSSYQAGRGDGPQPIARSSISEREIDRLTESEEFADRFPPFRPGKVFSRPDGTVWVQRFLRSSAPPIFDVFRRLQGKVAVVRLPAAREVIGVGSRHVYATIEGEIGLLSLERYQIPASIAE